MLNFCIQKYASPDVYSFSRKCHERVFRTPGNIVMNNNIVTIHINQTSCSTR